MDCLIERRQPNNTLKNPSPTSCFFHARVKLSMKSNASATVKSAARCLSQKDTCLKSAFTPQIAPASRRHNYRFHELLNTMADFDNEES